MKALVDDNGAVFSDCRNYRYALWRIWDPSKPLVMFIGLNPSKANEDKTDATITRVKTFANTWGYGGFYMMNCFPYVSTNPNDLKDLGNTVINDHWLYNIGSKCEEVIFVWGNFSVARKRGKELSLMFPNGKALVKNKNGTPRHPLYVKGDVEPVRFAPL